MKIRFYNARIMAMQDGVSIQKGELWTKDDRILYVGSDKNPEEESFDREIDCENNLLMPGFKNAHTHSAMTFLRSFADDLPLQEWLYNRVFPMEAKLTKEDQVELAKLGMMEYLTSGITANFDMYLDNTCHAKASTELGFRTVLCGSMNDFGGTVPETEEEYYRLNDYSPLVSYKLGFHAEYTTSRPLLEGVAKIADKYHAPVWTHNSETEREVAECKARWGMTPMQFTESLGLYEHGGGGYHCVWLEEKDIEILKKHHMSVVTNPGSNTKLASGICPVKRLLDEGINLAIGTDGPASNNCLDMFREMFLVTGLAKLRERDASCMPADEVLYMATAGGAYAMGLPDCDCLAVGKKADLVMIDLRQPNMQPENNLVKNLVYSGSKQNVKLTMVNGKVLYEDGIFLIGFDPAEIYTKANEIIGRMKECR